MQCLHFKQPHYTIFFDNALCRPQFFLFCWMFFFSAVTLECLANFFIPSPIAFKKKTLPENGFNENHFQKLIYSTSRIFNIDNIQNNRMLLWIKYTHTLSVPRINIIFQFHSIPYYHNIQRPPTKRKFRQTSYTSNPSPKPIAF